MAEITAVTVVRSGDSGRYSGGYNGRHSGGDVLRVCVCVCGVGASQFKFCCPLQTARGAKGGQTVGNGERVWRRNRF